VESERAPAQGRDHSISVTLPPMAVVVFKRRSEAA
jgi:hypothetical protein